MKTYDTIIIGAGPAGLMAAIFAARQGRKVLVVEKMKQVGLKLLASGGGRGNITNTLGKFEFMEKFGRNGRFVFSAIEFFDADGVREFLAKRGVKTVSPNGFAVYPESNSSQDVLDVLLNECQNFNVDFLLETTVHKIMIKNQKIEGVIINNELICAKKIIVATGGKSYSPLGGSESGYKLLQQVGHKVTETFPALTNIVLKEFWCAKCAGLSLNDVELNIHVAHSRNISLRGDILFTHTGISGPVALNLSGEVAYKLRKKKEIPLLLKLFPEKSFHDLEKIFENWLISKNKKVIKNLLRELIPLTLVEVLCMEIGNIGDKTVYELKKTEKDQFINFLYQIPLTAISVGGFEKAMVTRGGVSLKEVNPQTMESKIVAGLFICGEVLDIDGPCGGFHLQMCFSTGALAGN